MIKKSRDVVGMPAPGMKEGKHPFDNPGIMPSNEAKEDKTWEATGTTEPKDMTGPIPKGSKRGREYII